MKTFFSNYRYQQFLLLVSGLGGLLYGIDIGVIDPALSYLNRSINLSETQLSAVVAAVLAGSIMGSVVAGVLADWFGRKRMMLVSGLMFIGSVAIISVSQSFEPLILGRLLQGMSGGVIAVVVPLYLAECLPSAIRGRGVAVFQFMLTLGIVLAAFVGSYYVGNAERAIQFAGSDQKLIHVAADHAWRGMFLAVAYPGILFVLGTCLVSESPRWLLRHGHPARARAALLRMHSTGACDLEIADIGASLANEHETPKRSFATGLKEIFTERRYVMPFILACIVLGCNQATGINSLLQYMSTILQKAGLDPVAAAGYGTAIKIINSAMTVVAIMLVERKGRVFLLKLGTGGVIAALFLLAALFYSDESKRIDVRSELAAMVKEGTLAFDLESVPFARASPMPLQISIVYRYGDKKYVVEGFMPTAESKVTLNAAAAIEKQLSGQQRTLLRHLHVIADGAAPPSREDDLAALADSQRLLVMLPQTSRAVLDAAKRIRSAQSIRIAPDSPDAGRPLEIIRAWIGPIPNRHKGVLTALCIAAFIAFFAVGPGVCGWLALSELMPNRIRSVGMGVALLINQGVGAIIAAAFLPMVGNYGFYAVFLFWAGCTVIYFITAAFFLPETKGKTLEQIETFFTSDRAAAAGKLKVEK